MNNLKKTVAIVITMLMAIFLVSCSSKGDLDGTYTYKEDGASMTITINGDKGRVKIQAGDDNAALNLALNNIEFTIDRESKTFNFANREDSQLYYSVSGNSLTVRGGGFGSVTLQKK
ncbi:hypothetical protein SCODD09_00656 [Streptococcus constellatus]|nr:hypothetical protein SCODD09_00656 [Streptococcus constellatus]